MYPRTKTLRRPFFVREASGYVQGLPRTNPMPYVVWGGSDSIYDSEFPVSPVGWAQPYAMVYLDTVGESLREDASARAYDKLMGQVKGEANAMLAVNIAERKQAFSMISKRSMQLLKAARAMKNLDLPGFLTALGYTRRKTRSSTKWVRDGRGRTHTLPAKTVAADSYALQKRAKSAGSLWLEYWFGWSPLLSDIHSSVNVLQNTPPAATRRTFRGSGSANSVQTLSSDQYGFSRYVITYRARYQCNVDVTNADLFRANALGLTNPLTVAWEVVPFSFLVDWFLPVSRFLDSYTDTLGLSITRVIVSTGGRAQFVQVLSHPERAHTMDSNGYRFSRSIPSSLPLPGLLDRRGTAIQSLTRAATAVSLLTGFFKTSKFA